jgi:GH24 family phage-related lysozyme (muramidase)
LVSLQYAVVIWLFKSYTNRKIPDIGWGHDCTKNKDCASFKPPLKQVPDGDNLFTKDIAKYSKALEKNLPNMDGLNENQLAALVSFTYNCGGENGKKIKKHWLSYMQKRDFDGICKALPTTCIPSNKKVAKGVTRRRNGEANLCSKTTKVMSGC